MYSTVHTTQYLYMYLVIRSRYMVGTGSVCKREVHSRYDDMDSFSGYGVLPYPSGSR